MLDCRLLRSTTALNDSSINSQDGGERTVFWFFLSELFVVHWPSHPSSINEFEFIPG